MENETLIDYVKQFKQLWDVVISQWSTGILDIYADHIKEYQDEMDDTKKKNWKELLQSSDGLSTYVRQWPKQVWITHERICSPILIR